MQVENALNIMKQEIGRSTYIALKDVVEEFVEGEASGALLIRGPWGVGKTCAVREALGVSGNGKLRPHFYVSLYGVRTQDELYQQIVLGACGKWTGKNDTKSRRIVGDVLKAANSFFGDSIIKLPTENTVKGSVISSLALATLGQLISGAIVVIDDLERNGGMTMEEVLGSISRLVEVRKCKVIAICNPDELGINENGFQKQHEKIFEREFLYSPAPGENAQYVTEVAFRDVVLQAAERLKCSNIRVMKKAVDLVTFVNKRLMATPSVSREAFMSSLAQLAFLYFAYRNKIELAKARDFPSFNVRQFLGREDVAKVSFTEEKLECAQYEPNEGVSYAIEIVENGTTDWVRLREFLFSSSERIVERVKQEEFERIVFGVLGSFSKVPDDFKSRVVSFVETNVSCLDIYHVEVAGMYLKEIWGDGSYTQRWEGEWLDANISKLTQEKLTEIIYHRSDVSELVKERAMERYREFFPKPSVSQAFSELFAGNANDICMDVLKHLSLKECREWLMENEDSACISNSANFVVSAFQSGEALRQVAMLIARSVFAINDCSEVGKYRKDRWVATVRRLSKGNGEIEAFLQRARSCEDV